MKKIFEKTVYLIVTIAFFALRVPLVLTKDRSRLIPTGRLTDGQDAVFDCDIAFGDREAKAIGRRYANAGANKRSRAFAALLGLPQSIEDAALGWRIFLLCLLSTVADLLVGAIPSLPIVELTGLTTAPRALINFILAFSPFRHLTGKKSRVRRPTVLESVVPLGSTSVSSDPVDYLGGKISVPGYGKLPAWLPLALVPVVVASNVPTGIVDTLLTSSPLALLLLCGVRKTSSARFTFRWGGTSFETMDCTLLSQIEKWLPLIQSEVLYFGAYIRDKEKRRTHVTAGMTDFFPVSHAGRFTKVLDADPEIRIWAAALSAFRELLRFASDEAEWCSREDADRWLLEAWQAVLPESAPTPPSENAVAVRGDSVSVFWEFLISYIGEHRALVAKTPRSNPSAIAELHEFDGTRFLIIPRRNLLTAYNTYLDQHGGAPLSMSSDGVELARLLRNSWGMGIRTEGENEISWRYQFYAKGQAPAGEKDKQPCVAIPVCKTPEGLRVLLSIDSDTGSDGEKSPSGNRKTSMRE